MAEIEIPNQIVAGEPANAAPVQANFDYIEGVLANTVVHADGSKAFTALPSAPTDVTPSAGQLVTKKHVEDLTGILAKKIKNDGSAYGFSEDWQDLGVTLGPFAWPKIQSGHALTISLYVPQILVGTYNDGAWPPNGWPLEIALFNGDHTLLQIGSSTYTGVGPLEDKAPPSLFMQRTFFDNSWRQAGVTTTLNLKGRVTSGTGKFKLQGSANTPIEFIARLG